MTADPRWPALKVEDGARGLKMPTEFWRVDFLVGFGFPEVTRRVRRQRNFTDAARVSDLLRGLNEWPEHHRLIAVHHVELAGAVVSDLQLAELLDQDDTLTARQVASLAERLGSALVDGEHGWREIDLAELPDPPAPREDADDE